MKNFWIDMDGVLAVYDLAGYLGNNPAYLDVNAHYYRKREPDERAIQMAKLLNEAFPENVFVLTSVSGMGLAYIRQVEDKADWLTEYCPFLDLSRQFVPTASGKRDIVNAIYRPADLRFTRGDVLIDDYNKNLDAWNEAGGTAVKYCNGINTPNRAEPKSSFSGIHITQDMTPEDILRLLTLLQKYQKGGTPNAAGRIL